MRSFNDYFILSSNIGDIDPQNDCLRYICNRFELNIEQRYWMAFLFACTYCGATSYYIYNEFPDFENVDVYRLQDWWNKNKDKLLFQTDRLRIKTNNKFVECFVSYKQLIGDNTQSKFFNSICNSNPNTNYDKLLGKCLEIKNFGRFTMFIYLEMMHVLTNIKIYPKKLHVEEAKSCMDGLLFALGKQELIDKKITKKGMDFLESEFIRKVSELKKINPKTTAWSVETALCAYKKYNYGKRWIGYYIDRQHDEIVKMSKTIQYGVNWSPLWDFRKEFYNKDHLTELTGKRSSFESEYL